MKLHLKVFLIVLGLVASTAWHANATGTVRIQQTNGKINVYKNAYIEVNNRVLSVTTADKKGTLIVDKAACSYVGKILRCLPESMKLQQGGKLQKLDFQRGTIYVNNGDTTETLPYSSTRVPPNGVILSLTTDIGTIVDLVGIVDKESK